MEDTRRYNVILTGQLRPGGDPEQVHRRVARLYRIDPERVARVLAQGPRVIKREVSRAKAERYVRLLRKAGAEVLMVSVGELSEPDPVPAAELSDTASPTGIARRRWPLLTAAVALLAAVATVGVMSMRGAGPASTPAALEVEPAKPVAEPVADARGAPPPAPSIAEAKPALAPTTATQVVAVPVTPSSVPQPPRPAAPDRPFGLAAGDRLADVAGNAVDLGGGDYRLAAVPQPDARFGEWRLRVAPRAGLCRIDAVGVAVATPPDGSALRAAFDAARRGLDAVYGPHLHTELLRGAATETSWMGSLVRGERLVATRWTRDAGARLPPTLAEVELRAAADEPSAGRLLLIYRFTNAGDCDAELATR